MRINTSQLPGQWPYYAHIWGIMGTPPRHVFRAHLQPSSGCVLGGRKAGEECKETPSPDLLVCDNAKGTESALCQGGGAAVPLSSTESRV